MLHMPRSGGFLRTAIVEWSVSYAKSVGVVVAEDGAAGQCVATGYVEVESFGS
jgi:hypothetical protein